VKRVVRKTRMENAKGNIWNKEKGSGTANEDVRDTNENLTLPGVMIRWDGIVCHTVRF
jgi:hypothetical protein